MSYGYVITLNPLNQMPFREVEFFFTSEKVPYLVSFQKASSNRNYPSFYRLSEDYCIDRILMDVLLASLEGVNTPRNIQKKERLPQALSTTPWYEQDDKSIYKEGLPMWKDWLQQYEDEVNPVTNRQYLEQYTDPDSFWRLLNS